MGPRVALAGQRAKLEVVRSTAGQMQEESKVDLDSKAVQTEVTAG